MSFVSRQPVRFAHVDAAGIVFYPRYFEMVNAVVEDFFADVVGASFFNMHIERRVGVPTVRLEANFTAVSRLGDTLEFVLSVRKVGKSSAMLEIEACCGAERRFHVNLTLVCVNLTSGRGIPWPNDLRPIPDEAAGDGPPFL